MDEKACKFVLEVFQAVISINSVSLMNLHWNRFRKRCSEFESSTNNALKIKGLNYKIKGPIWSLNFEIWSLKFPWTKRAHKFGLKVFSVVISIKNVSLMNLHWNLPRTRCSEFESSTNYALKIKGPILKIKGPIGPLISNQGKQLPSRYCEHFRL